MHYAWLERLALRDTGRLRAPGAGAKCRLIVYPANLTLTPLLPRQENSVDRYIEYGGGRNRGAVRRCLATMHRVVGILGHSRRIDFYLMSSRRDRWCALGVAVLARLAGIPMVLHDYGFVADVDSRATVYSLARSVVLGDATAFDGACRLSPHLSVRVDYTDPAEYDACRKNRAVPRVIVYGDFDDSRVVSLMVRTHELIKQKYPRTEFFPLCPMSPHISLEGLDGSIHPCRPQSEAEVREVFEEADTLLLLSAGGVNRFLIRRARTAGIPVVTNGLAGLAENGDSGFITAVRDSYSALAEKIIGLVDDESYYRDFA